MSEALGLTLTALGAMVVSGAVLSLVVTSRRRRQDEEGSGTWTAALATQLPTSVQGREEIREQLQQAGHYQATAINDYLAIRTIVTLGALFATGLLALLVPASLMVPVVLGGLMATVLAFSLPRVWLSMASRSRKRRILKGLPIAVDMLSLSLSGGQALPEGLAQTAAELQPIYPDLSHELRIVSRHAGLHSTGYALDQFAQRVSLQEVRSLALLLVQAERLGTDTLETLQEFNSNLRTQWRQRAEAQANRASFWMLFPSIFCLWIAAAIVLVGPPYLEFWQFREEQISPLVQGARSNVEETNQPGGQPTTLQPTPVTPQLAPTTPLQPTLQP